MGSIHGRLSSIDEASSFFEKVQLHFQLADLLVELVLLGVGLLAHLLAAVAEDVGQAGQRLFLPAADLGRVDAEHLRDLGRRLVRLDGLHGHLGLQAGRVRDIKEHIVGLWIIELPELSSLGKSDVNRIKAFLSSRTTRFRFAYGRRTTDVPRQCVFIGTVNHSQYLRDETGNRRFWPVKTGKIDMERLKQDRDQLWAEALALYREGNKWWSDDPTFIREAERQQEARYERDPWDDLIREYLASKNDTAVPEILADCIRKDKGLWSPLDERRVARCLVSQGWEKHRPRNGKQRQWRYKRKN